MADVHITNDFSVLRDDPLRVPDSELEKAPDAAFRWFRKDDSRLEAARRRGYVRCESEKQDLVLHRTTPENKQRWHDAVAQRTEEMTNPAPREHEGIRSEGVRRRGAAPERAERPHTPRNRTYSIPS